MIHISWQISWQRYTIIDLCWGGHGVYVILTDVEPRSIWLSLLFNNTPCLLKHKSTIVLFYDKCVLCISCHFGPLKPLTLRMDHAKLHDVLTSLPISHAILPYTTSQSANHATCSYISGSGFAYEPIRRCLFIDYIITCFINFLYSDKIARKSGRKINHEPVHVEWKSHLQGRKLTRYLTSLVPD